MFSKIKKLINKYKEFLSFCLVGGLNTLVSLIVFSILVLITGVSKEEATLLTIILNVISDIAGGINSYLWNRFWVFKKSNTSTKESLPKFVVTFCIYIAISSILFSFFQWLLPVHEIVIKIIVLPITTIINFLMNKLWAFKKTDKFNK
ncbi:MAG: GtrA family protein [Ruminococcaceae bacterium]|nr:GtrA family protein [Oscillospiraceae bacterium]